MGADFFKEEVNFTEMPRLCQNTFKTLSSNSSSYYTDAIPILSPLSEDIPSPINDDQLEHDLAKVIQQQQIPNSNSPISIHRLTHSYHPSTGTSRTELPHRASRVLSKYINQLNVPRKLASCISTQQINRSNHLQHKNPHEF